jgi:hypothetical protein
MRTGRKPDSAGRAFVWLLVAVTVNLGIGIPIHRAASQGSTDSCIIQ